MLCREVDRLSGKQLRGTASAKSDFNSIGIDRHRHSSAISVALALSGVSVLSSSAIWRPHLISWLCPNPFGESLSTASSSAAGSAKKLRSLLITNPSRSPAGRRHPLARFPLASLTRDEET